eukprot:11527655-Alexandrium_andersonii.AAC.1
MGRLGPCGTAGAPTKTELHRLNQDACSKRAACERAGYVGATRVNPARQRPTRPVGKGGPLVRGAHA